MLPSGQKLLRSLLGRIQFFIATVGPESVALPGKFGVFTANSSTPVTVADEDVTANSMILIGLKTVGGTVGAIPAVQTKTAGTGFTVLATASDTSVYTYLILG